MAPTARSKGLQELFSKQAESICPLLLMKPGYWNITPSHEALSLSSLHIVLARAIYDNFDLVAPSFPLKQQNKRLALAISDGDEQTLAMNYLRFLSEPCAVDETEFYTCAAFLHQQRLDWRSLLNVAFERNFFEWDGVANTGVQSAYKDSEKVPGAPVITVCISSLEAYLLSTYGKSNGKRMTAAQRGPAILPA